MEYRVGVYVQKVLNRYNLNRDTEYYLRDIRGKVGFSADLNTWCLIRQDGEIQPIEYVDLAELQPDMNSYVLYNLDKNGIDFGIRYKLKTGELTIYGVLGYATEGNHWVLIDRGHAPVRINYEDLSKLEKCEPEEGCDKI